MKKSQPLPGGKKSTPLVSARGAISVPGDGSSVPSGGVMGHLNGQGEGGHEGHSVGPLYFNRDLSWLEFNRRVLVQAADSTVPLLDRVRFLTIFTSNLDEFFMKRVGILKRTVHAGIDTVAPDGMTPRQQLVAIRGLVSELVADQVEIFKGQIVPALEAAGITLARYADLSHKDKKWAEEWYRANVFPTLTPLAVDPTHRFPFISNLSTNLAILAESPEGKAQTGKGGSFEGQEHLFARLKFPPNIKRFITLPQRDGTNKGVRLVYLNDIIRNNLDDLFPGMKLEETVAFRVTRSAGIQKDDLDTDNLLRSVEAELKQRKFARVVRLELEHTASPAMGRWLLDKLNIHSLDVYDITTDIDFLSLSEIYDIDRPDLKNKPWKPVIPARLAQTVTRPTNEKLAANFFAAIRKQDILVHHPYDSFSASVERFISAAANDPDVLTIKQTLYRTSPDSPFVEQLIRAAESGKQVACLIELRARFDEDRNVRLARVLEKTGVHVAYGVAGLKTHCKTSLVVRKERHGLRCYAHFGTGNYHPKTAHQYTDVGLLTCDPVLTTDLVNLFNYLTGLAATQSYEALLVAPNSMRSKFNMMIDREVENAKKGLVARIIVKINSMEDRDIVQRLYAASQAGVKITLIVRGFCCLRPGVPGLSENIKVISIIGRFLEHSRIFHFAAGEEDQLDGEWYISSADWMYRNLSNRVEVGVPVRDPVARARLAKIIDIHLEDSRQAWELAADGSYTRRSVPEGADPESTAAMGTFETLMRMARGDEK